MATGVHRIGGGSHPAPPPSYNPPPGPPPKPLTYNQQSALAALRQFLIDNGLPSSLLAFIQGEITANKSFDEIVADLRQTAEYKAAYPENALRQANGFDWWSEAQIREYRSQAIQLAQQYGGFTPTSAQIAKEIGNNVDLQEWANRIQKYQDFQRWGPTVKRILGEELGRNISDTEAFAMLDPEIPTPELDRAYELAILRGAPDQLGLGVRPEQEAEQLRQLGVSVNQALSGYGQVAGNLPAVERAMAIEGHLNGSDNMPGAHVGDSELPFGTLFASVFYNDARGAAARQKLQYLMANEIARFQGGGGPVARGTQAVGLLDRNERAQLQ